MEHNRSQIRVSLVDNDGNLQIVFSIGLSTDLVPLRDMCRRLAEGVPLVYVHKESYLDLEGQLEIVALTVSQSGVREGLRQIRNGPPLFEWKACRETWTENAALIDTIIKASHPCYQYLIGTPHDNAEVLVSLGESS